MEMHLKVKILNKLTVAEAKLLKDFSDKNWGKHYDTPEQIARIYFAAPSFIVVAYIDDEIVGIQYVFLRDILFTGIIKLGGLGGLVVDKNFRHKGIATKLLKSAISEMKKNKVDISILATDIKKLGKIYKRVGFVELGRPYFYSDNNGKEEFEEGGMIAPILSKKYFKLVLNSKEKLKVGVSNF